MLSHHVAFVSDDPTGSESVFGARDSCILRNAGRSLCQVSVNVDLSDGASQSAWLMRFFGRNTPEVTLCPSWSMASRGTWGQCVPFLVTLT